SAPGSGGVIKKWRMYAYGAHFQSSVFFGTNPWIDANASGTGTSGLAFSTTFKTTTNMSGSTIIALNSITLFDKTLTPNFHVNSWVLLMALETFVSQSVNWAPQIFEY